jgi:hypothetical protein
VTLGEVAAIEVVREGSFAWQVHTRIPDALDMCLNQPFWFRWRAERYARRRAGEERRRITPPAVSRIELGIERELSG